MLRNVFVLFCSVLFVITPYHGADRAFLVKLESSRGGSVHIESFTRIGPTERKVDSSWSSQMISFSGENKELGQEAGKTQSLTES